MRQQDDYDALHAQVAETIEFLIVAHVGNPM